MANSYTLFDPHIHLYLITTNCFFPGLLICIEESDSHNITVINIRDQTSGPPFERAPIYLYISSCEDSVPGYSNSDLDVIY